MRSRFPALLATLALACAPAVADEPPVPDESALRAMNARFAPVDIEADISGLPRGERAALGKLIEAARVMHALYLQQVWAGNPALLSALVAGRHTGLGEARLHAFVINAGPWSRLDHDAPFLPGVPPRPPAANFYPAGATKEEVEGWLSSLSGAERSAATGFFTTIRRAPDGALVSVPYRVEYQGELARAAGLLREAAKATEQPTLRSYLEKRAEAFLDNDYLESDMAWMELDSAIEPTIGPYEVYDDGWFGYKAAFEAFIGVRDEEETRKLARFSGELQWLEDRLPIRPEWRNPKIGALAPLRVIDLVFSSGQANSDVQTAAFNLPNDARVVAAKGSKRVMLKNIQEAKFDEALVPISRIALAPADQGRVSFDAFFTHILMHELVHGIGPKTIVVDGRETTVRAQLKELRSPLEEAKADIVGLWAMQQLVDKGVLDASFEDTMYTTFLASSFRSIRFGITEAHGRGQALQLNDLLDRGGFVVNPDGTFSVDRERIRDAVEALSRELLTLQAEGSYEKGQAILERLALIRPETRRVLDRLEGVPVDIEPRFVTAEDLTRH
jgi:hypothetical protein